MRTIGCVQAVAVTAWVMLAACGGVATYQGSQNLPASVDDAPTEPTSPSGSPGTGATTVSFRAPPAFVPAGLIATTPAQPPPASPPPAAAQLWVSPTGDDSRCARLDPNVPCATFQRAYELASAGDEVEVVGGSYPAQRLEEVVGKGASPITFRPATGARPAVAQLDFGQTQLGVRAPSHVVVRDLDIVYSVVWDTADDVVLQGIRGKTFDVIGASNVRVLGGDYGPCEAPAFPSCTNRLIGKGNVVDGARIHDVTSTDLANFHVDGMFIRGCQGCTVRRTSFFGNYITNIRIQNCCGLVPNQDIVLEENFFGAPLQGANGLPRGDGVDVDNDVAGLRIRFNSFAPETGIAWPTNSSDQYVPNSDARVVANILAGAPGWLGCAPGVTFERNVAVRDNGFTNPNLACGSDLLAPTWDDVAYRGPSPLGPPDYHLLASSWAKGAGTTDELPLTDIDGDSRAVPSPSAGADEP